MMRGARRMFRLAIEAIIFVAIATLFWSSHCSRILLLNSSTTSFRKIKSMSAITNFASRK